MYAVDIAQLAHAANECILCREGRRRALPKLLWGGLVNSSVKTFTKTGKHFAVSRFVANLSGYLLSKNSI